MADELSEDDAISLAKSLLKVREAEARRLNVAYAYVKGEVSRLYVPRRATAEYRALIAMSKVNIMPLLVNAYAETLFVEGYRPARQAENAGPWKTWQANRMDARQNGLHRSVLQYGLAFVVVLPGKPEPVMRPVSPRQMTAVYEDSVADEWPVYALSCEPGWDAEKRTKVDRLSLYDSSNRYKFRSYGYGRAIVADGVEAHNLGVCPVVRYLNHYGDLDDCAEGEVEPMMPLQDQINQTTFGLKMAEHYAAHRQRWVTGMAMAVDADGREVEPFNVGVDRMIQGESPDTKFGDFAATELDPYLNSRQSSMRIAAALAQIPPQTLLVSDGIANLSAEALAAVEASFQRNGAEKKVSLGESHEQTLRLCGKASGDTQAWDDTSAQVVWRDTESRSLAQLADAFGKMAQMLGVPPRALWERLPNVTEQDIERWERMADEDQERAAEQAALIGANGAEPGNQPTPRAAAA